MGRDRPESYHRTSVAGKGVATVSSLGAPNRETPSPPAAPTSASLTEVSALLRIEGFGPATGAFDRLAAQLPGCAGQLGMPLLRALAEAREHLDALAAADLLDGGVAPRLGITGALASAEPCPVDELRLELPATPRRASKLDAAAESLLQMRAIGAAAQGPIALLGARGTGVVGAIAALKSAHPLYVWDPDDDPALALLGPSARPVLQLRAGNIPAVPECSVWLHPSLGGSERRDAERVRARLRGARPRPDPARFDPRGPLRLVVLLRETPFHLDAPLVATLRALGHPTAVATVYGDARDDELASTLASQRPDLVLSVNGAALTRSAPLRAALAVAEVPTALWFVDDPELALGDALDLAAPHVLAFAWEREAVARLRALGFSGARYLPHGARYGAASFAAPPSALPDAPLLLWIGSSYAGGDRTRLHAGAAAPDPDWESLERRLAADPRLAPAALRRALHRPAGRGELFHQLRAADHVAAQRRAAVARALLPAGLTIFGDVEGWRSQLGPSARILGDVDAMSVAPHLVAGARISVDCVHPQMPTAVTQRVFDVPACGGLVLADDRPDLRAAFEVGIEVLAYESPGHAAELARWALRHPELRQRIAEAARRRVFREHLLEHRVRRLLQETAHHFDVRGTR